MMGSQEINISDQISAKVQSFCRQLCPTMIDPLDFRDIIIFFVAVSAAAIAVHLLFEVVRDLKIQLSDNKKHIQGDFPDGLKENKSVFVAEADVAIAEELQYQEALFASLCATQSINEASSSTQKFCEICLENKENWEMFKNDKCSHSFCFDCTTKYITVRIEEPNTQEITCPAVNCKTPLNTDVVRILVPIETQVKWDEAVCKSMYLESQKLYCPFSDCSSMLVNDTGEALTKSTCPLCKRSFCAKCKVPWHSEFTCKEFKKLSSKRGKDKALVMMLASKKNWQKCPQCKMIVEKSEGCLHMTCRCKYEFCYRCGKKWSSTHGGCKERQVWLST